MTSNKTIVFTLSLLLSVSTALGSQHGTDLDYNSFKPEYTSIYSGEPTSATLNYTTGTSYDSCSLYTDRSSLPLGWSTSEPKSIEPNSTGNHQIETPEITAADYPANTTIRFTMECSTSNSTATIPLEMTIGLKNPSELPYTFIKENAPYAILAVLVIGLIGAFSGRIRENLGRKISKHRAEKLSQELIQDLQKRSYTPPEAREKINTAQQRIQEENYNDAIELLRDADDYLDRT